MPMGNFRRAVFACPLRPFVCPPYGAGRPRPPTVAYERCFETGEIQTAHSDVVGALWATVRARLGRVLCAVSNEHHHPHQFRFLVPDRCCRVVSGRKYGTTSQHEHKRREIRRQV